MSNNGNRMTNIEATGPRGRRGGRPPRGNSRDRGFHFNLNAQMALTQHLLRRGHNLRHAATNAISLIVGHFHDAPLNARKLDKNVVPKAVDRINILQTDPISLFHPSTRQDLHCPLALTPLSPAHNPVLIEN
jgi:hypothetical protein